MLLTGLANPRRMLSGTSLEPPATTITPCRFTLPIIPLPRSSHTVQKPCISHQPDLTLSHSIISHQKAMHPPLRSHHSTTFRTYPLSAPQSLSLGRNTPCIQTRRTSYILNPSVLRNFNAKALVVRVGAGEVAVRQQLAGRVAASELKFFPVAHFGLGLRLEILGWTRLVLVKCFGCVVFCCVLSLSFLVLMKVDEVC